MTEEQKRRICEILSDYDRFAELASNNEWIETKYECIRCAINKEDNHWVEFITVDFDKGFVSEHFDEAVVAMMIMFISLAEDWSQPDGWKDMTVQERFESFTRARYLYENYVGSPEVWTMDSEMDSDEFEEAVFTCCNNYDRSYIEPKILPEAKPVLERFCSGEHYWVGNGVGSGGGLHTDWIAMKGDSFLYVYYYAGWD